MPLPIIIILERHWDHTPSKTLDGLLKKLTEYDTLCVEYSFDLPLESIIADRTQKNIIAEQAIKKINRHFAGEPGISLQSLDGSRMDVILPVDIKALATLSEHYLNGLVSQVYSDAYQVTDIVSMIKFYEANTQKLDNMKHMLWSRKQVVPIDIDTKKHNYITSQTGESLIRMVDYFEPLRIKSFVSRLLELKDNGKSCIFCVGEDHYAGLANLFLEKARLQEVIFVRAYKPCTALFAVETDFALPQGDIRLPNLTLMEKAINSEVEIQSFVERIVTKIRPSQVTSMSFFTYNKHNINLALRQAASVADLDTVSILLSIDTIAVNDAEFGINPKNGKPFSGRTALHQAILALQKETQGSLKFERCKQVIECLLNHGADPELKDAEGNSCLDIIIDESIRDLVVINQSSADLVVI